MLLLPALLAVFGTQRSPQPCPVPPAAEVPTQSSPWASPPPEAAPAPLDIRRGVGFQALDGRLFGNGPDYQVEFLPEGIVYVPLLGRQAPETWPLRLRLESVRLGQRELSQGRADRVERQGLRYSRFLGPIEERVDLQTAGVEVSYVLSQRPESEGDWVVRLAFDCEQPGRASSAGGLDFSHPTFGGATVSGVVGIDAAGQRCEGSTRLVGDHIEWSLPADFVARAALPLVLDPLIATTTTVSAIEEDQEFDAIVRSGVASVVFVKSTSLGAQHIYRQNVLPSGALDDGPALISGSSAFTQGINSAPSIGWVLEPAITVCCWEHRSSSASLPRIQWRSSYSNQSAPDNSIKTLSAPSNAADTDPEMGTVEWKDTSKGYYSLQLAFTRVQSGVSRALVVKQTLPGTGLSWWHINFGSPTPMSTLAGKTTSPRLTTEDTGTFALLLDAPGSPARRIIQVSDQVIDMPGHDITHFSIAAGRRSGPSAYPTAQEFEAGYDERILFRAVPTADPNLGGRLYIVRRYRQGSVWQITTPMLLNPEPADDEIDPCIVHAYEKYILSYSRRAVAGGQYELRVVDLDHFGGAPRTMAVLSATTTPRKGSLAAAFACVGLAGGPEKDQFLALYESTIPAPPPSQVKLPAVKAKYGDALGSSGTVVEINPGCGGLVADQDSHPAIGDSLYEFRLTTSFTGTQIGFLNLVTGNGTSLGCSACSLLLPELTYPTTFLAGKASISLQIPNKSGLIGAEFQAQWLTFGADLQHCPQFPGIGVSNIRRFTIGT